MVRMYHSCSLQAIKKHLLLYKQGSSAARGAWYFFFSPSHFAVGSCFPPVRIGSRVGRYTFFLDANRDRL